MQGRQVPFHPGDSAEVSPFDTRSSEELESRSRGDGDVLQRDRALWELVARKDSRASAAAAEVARNTDDPRLFRSATWALLRTGSTAELEELVRHAPSANDVAWVRMLTLEAHDEFAPPDERPVRRAGLSAFDETVPLDIAGFARVKMPDGTAIQATVSPIWFERVVGSVTACTQGESFDHTLVIEKRMPAFYPDGRDHIEGFLFRGLTTRLPDGRYQHVYECLQTHRMFRSGRVGDDSDGVIDDVRVNLARAAETATHPSLEAGDGPLVTSVRGSFYGFAYVRPDLVMANGDLHPGMVQLVSPSDPAAGALANTYLYGHFRGMPRDVDSDGTVEVDGIAVGVNVMGESELSRSR